MQIHYLKKRIPAILMTACFVVLFCDIHGQKKLQPGYIITVSGDKINGYIDYLDWEKNPSSITFSETAEGQGKEYLPLQIKSFGLKDKMYRGAIVSVEQSSYNTESLSSSPELTYRQDTIFLEVLYQGDKSLYYYKDQSGKPNFYIERDSKPELLILKRYTNDETAKTIVITNREYRKQLAAYLRDCPPLNAELANVEYNEKELSILFAHYYKNCSGSQPQYSKKRERAIVETGILAGISSTTLKFKHVGDDAFLYLQKAGFSSSENFAGGVFVNFILPRNFGRWVIANELLFASYKMSGMYNDYHNSDYYIITKTTIGFSQLKLVNMLRYRFPVNKGFLFLNAGIANAFAVSETNKAQRDVHMYSTVTLEDGKALKDPRKYEQGYVLGAGGQYKRYSVDLRMEAGNGMSKISTLQSPTRRLYFLLGYRF